MERVRMFTDLKSEISNLKSLAETIARQVHGRPRHLQDPPFRGQRYLSDIQNASSRSVAARPRRIHKGIGRDEEKDLGPTGR